MFNIQTNIELDGENVILTDIQETGKIDEVKLMAFKTYPEINFVKISTNDGDSGVAAEHSWIRYKYPGFKPTKQSLAKKEVNGEPLYFDVLDIENAETKEVKKVYFEISDFFGK